MKRWFSTAVVSAVVLYGCGPTSESVVEDAAAAMGGAEAVLATNTLVLSGTGQTYRLGQQPNPDADLPIYELHEYRKEIDLQNQRWRVDQLRTGHFTTGNPVNRQPLIQAVDGSIAYDVGADGTARRVGGRAPFDRQAEFYHHPLTLVRAALTEGGATLGELRVEGEGHAVDVTPAGAPTFTLHVDAAGVPTRIESMGYDPNYGDVVVATTFTDYAAAGELSLPGTISQTLGKYKNGDFTVTSEPNGAIQTLAAPADVAAAPEPAPQPVQVTSEQIAPGVWYLRAGYNSTLIEFPTYGVLVEAPQNDARSLAGIQAAREILGEKPLRYLINTHFHIDHSGGIRAAVAEGLTIVTHELHKPYFEEVVAASHTIVQDHLAQNPKPLQIETVAGDGPMEITEGDRTIQLYRLKEDIHADGMLLVYLPRERILIEGDPFTPGARAVPWAENLLTQIQALGLRVDRIAPIHGDMARFTDLQRVVRELQAARTQ
jgi:glyoxylase-like metal-dependent hydrolase (beta-lactamase superfamily II)